MSPAVMSPALMGSRLPERELDEPTLTRTELIAADEAEDLANEAYQSAFAAALQGRGPFWQTDPREQDCYDNEQAHALFLALRRACAMPGATGAERWGCLAVELRRQADIYAWHVAEKTA